MGEKRIGALLTPSMRKFYKNQPDGDDSGARTIYQRTRDRLASALEDADLLSTKLRDYDRRSIVDRYDDPTEYDTKVAKLLALYTAELDTDRVENIVEMAVRGALVLEGYGNPDVSVSILVDREPVDLDEVVEKVARGEEPTSKELTTLVLARDNELRQLSDEQVHDLLESPLEDFHGIAERIQQKRADLDEDV
ncbi:hypothetical protein EFA46_015990 (plasmid) [Halarchaeum sp. CBA1220]|uniref:hypothetical protein n=1 Tax=Halarchaeum sp. CBA1220 TaxID=1853682 RepID=UPI000F3A8CD0|nr:hypothetical protein [Halarchaeum sp. CBA1220]QLC35758.1 hypothetical protein EFA46_015990 [Halarchaeum sp. CBA1220]